MTVAASSCFNDLRYQPLRKTEGLVAYTPFIPVDTLIQATNLTDDGLVATQSTFTTASVAPVANSLVILSIANYKSGTTAIDPIPSGLGATWIKISTSNDAANQRRVTMWRDLQASWGSGTISIDFGGTTQTNCCWAVDQFTGTDQSGTHGSGAIIGTNIKTTDNEGTTTSTSVAMNALGNANNAIYGFIRRSSPAGITSCGAPTQQLSTFFVSGLACSSEFGINQTTLLWTYASTSAPQIALGIEIKALVNVTPSTLNPNPESDNYHRLLRRQPLDDLAQFTGFPFAPAATPTKFSPNPVDYYKPLRRQPVDDIGTFVEFPFSPAATPTAKWANPHEYYNPLKKTPAEPGFIAFPGAPAATSTKYQNNPTELRYVSIRRQTVDNIGIFIEFPFSPAATPTWCEPNPDIPRYIPLRRTEGFIQTGWQPVLTPANWFPNPHEYYSPLRKTPAEPGFVAFPGAPATTPTWCEPNPNSPRYQPLRNTEGFYALGWQSPLTPGSWFPNPNESRYAPIRKTEGSIVFNQSILSISTLTSAYWANSDDPRYVPLRKTPSEPGFIEFPFAPSATPTWCEPNPNSPRYQPIRRVDGSLAWTGGQGVILVLSPSTLPPNPSENYWPTRRVDGSLIFTEFPGAPAATMSSSWFNPDSPRYIPLRVTEGRIVQGGQPVLTPAVWQQWPDDPRYQPLRRTEGYTIQGWQPVLTPGSLFPNPNDPRYIPIRRTEGFNIQGWQPVLTRAERLYNPDDPRYQPLRRTEGFNIQGWQPVLTRSERLYNPNDPRYQSLRRTEGFISQGQIDNALTVNQFCISVSNDVPQYTLRRIEGFIQQGWQSPLTPGYSPPLPNDPRYQPLRVTEGYTTQGWQPVLTPAVWQQWPDDPRYQPLRRQSVDDIGFFVEFPFAPPVPSDIHVQNPDEPRYIPLRSAEGVSYNILLPPELLPWPPILIQTPDDPRYIPLRRQSIDDIGLRVAISFNGPPARIIATDGQVYKIAVSIDGQLWIAEDDGEE